MKKIYILDSTTFLQNYMDAFGDKPIVTVHGVLEEIKNPQAEILLDMFLKLGMEVLEPGQKEIDEVNETVKKTKDRVSNTDIKLLALALQFKNKGKECTLVSDDYAIQNLASLLKIEVLALGQDGIKKVLKWERKCTACKRYTNNEICEVCGSPTKFYSKRV